MPGLHIAAAILGLLIAGAVLASALETVVLPLEGFTRVARLVFASVHRVLVFGRPGRRQARTILFAPVALVSLPLVWMIAVTVGFGFIFWGFNAASVSESFVISGSSLFTLGFSKPDKAGLVWLTFIEATIGLGLVALLISYLPTIYGAYNAREKGIRVLRPFAGTPPSSVKMLQRLKGLELLETPDVWASFVDWFIDLEQSHTSFPSLCYFPDHSSSQSWVASAGTILDGAALLLCARGSIDAPSSRGALLTLAHGGPAMARIARAAGLPVEDPGNFMDLLERRSQPPPTVSVQPEEFATLVDGLEASAVATVVDRDQAWRWYSWIRSDYDRALRGLAGLTGAAPAPLTTDRPAAVGHPNLVGRRPIAVDWGNGALPVGHGPAGVR